MENDSSDSNSDKPESEPAPAPPTTSGETKKKFNLQVKDLQLKQAPMEAVVNRET